MPDGKRKHSSKVTEQHRSHHKRHHAFDERSDEENHRLRRQRGRHHSPDRDRRHRTDRERPETRGHERRWEGNHRIKQEPMDENEQERNPRDRSRVQNRRRRSNNPFKSEEVQYEWGKKEVKSEDQKVDPKDKEKPNFELSGKLAEDTNVFNGVVIKYNEPPEARKPKRRWRMYPFKGNEPLPYLPLHRQSAYLLGRSRAIVDIPTDHPSCSKQHAVLQFRLVEYERDDSTVGKRVRPYVIDLDSANGTFVNNNKITPRCYVELFEKDVLKFGFSTREYVVLHDESKADVEDDNVNE